MNKVLVTIGVLLIAVLTALFAVPSFVDWGRYRATFESEASRLLGRRVRVGEKVELQLLPTPYIAFENLRVANSSGRFDTPLLRADSFRLQLSASALLTGSITAQKVELRAPALRLALNKDGKGNWTGLLPGASAGRNKGLGALDLGIVHITNGTIELAGAGGAAARLEAVDGDLESSGPGGPFRFKGTYVLGGKVQEARLNLGEDAKAGAYRIKASSHAPKDSPARDVSFDGTLDEFERHGSAVRVDRGAFPQSAGNRGQHS